jgi:hypothetical protein
MEAEYLSQMHKPEAASFHQKIKKFNGKANLSIQNRSLANWLLKDKILN